MKHYKNKNNEIYAYDDDVSSEFLNSKIKELGLKKLTQKELEELNKPKEPTLEEVKAKFLSDVDALLNQKAHEKGYDNIATAASYAAMPNPFYDEGVAFFKWRSNVYTYCYGILEKVQKGELEISEENIARAMSDMPRLELPEASTQIEPSNEQGASNE
ncbi:hypothetical protein CCAL6883_09115 [Campylobacter sp. RM6883]|uniref:hypothetical protein n=1 Tax=Campylobacter californiensis TaxID=1032243 RepID=UPI0014527EBC|nr:hypothetical protein [Campylobacter sp. RM6914]MBE2985488.1 hypothetical protein [Campylobacter sp. RM6883]MBE2995893.1 hypothetical protein [Campylobacter sp. RM6913]QCD51218.1 hypothetical protein CCAL_1333 [Campylobacter sp. RM6914]